MIVKAGRSVRIEKGRSRGHRGRSEHNGFERVNWLFESRSAFVEVSINSFLNIGGFCRVHDEVLDGNKSFAESSRIKDSGLSPSSPLIGESKTAVPSVKSDPLERMFAELEIIGVRRSSIGCSSAPVTKLDAHVLIDGSILLAEVIRLVYGSPQPSFATKRAGHDNVSSPIE